MKKALLLLGTMCFVCLYADPLKSREPGSQVVLSPPKRCPQEDAYTSREPKMDSREAFPSKSSPLPPSLPMASSKADPLIASDPYGNQIAVWTENQIVMTSDLPLQGSWSMPLPLSSPMAIASSPQLEIDATGHATVIWLEDNGIKAASRPFGGEWTYSQIKPALVDVVSPLHLFEANGHSIAILKEGPNGFSSGGSQKQMAIGLIPPESSQNDKSEGKTHRPSYPEGFAPSQEDFWRKTSSAKKRAILGDHPLIDTEISIPKRSDGLLANAIDVPSSGVLRGAQIGFAAGTAAPSDGLIVSGNVGIGATSFSGKFWVVDSVGGFFFDGSGGTYASANRIKSTTTAAATGRDLVFVTDNAGSNSALYINTSGNVGIGTTTPQNKLEVSAGTRILGTMSAASSGVGLELEWDGTESNVQSFNRAAGTWQPIQVRGSYVALGDPSEIVRVTGGNVGIGTTSPNYPLHVYTTTIAGIALERSGDNESSFRIRANSADKYTFGYYPSYGFFVYDNINSAWRLVIDKSTGYVGIGTTGPGATLDVNGAIRVTGGTTGLTATTNAYPYLTGGYTSPVIGRLFIGDGTGWKFYFSARNASTISDLIAFTDSGYVGIGTTGPAQPLEVKGRIRITAIGSGDPASVLEMKNNAGSVGYFYMNNTGDYLLATPSTTALTILNSGNVGIGTTPSNKLEVNGSFFTSGGNFECRDGGVIDSTAVRVFNSGGNLYLQNGSGNNTYFRSKVGSITGTMDNSGNLSITGAYSGWGVCPIGSILAWHKSLTGTPALPAGWLECNGQVVSDGSSPYNGQTLPNLNGASSTGRFLRGSDVSGTLQADAVGPHNHVSSMDDTSFSYWGNGTVITGGVNNGTQSSKPGNLTGPPYGGGNIASENRPINMSVVWVIRIK